MSLEQNNYTKPLIGFSWDSKTEWDNAKVNAINSGEELAKLNKAWRKIS